MRRSRGIGQAPHGFWGSVKDQKFGETLQAYWICVSLIASLEFIFVLLWCVNDTPRHRWTGYFRCLILTPPKTSVHCRIKYTELLENECWKFLKTDTAMMTAPATTAPATTTIKQACSKKCDVKLQTSFLLRSAQHTRFKSSQGRIFPRIHLVPVNAPARLVHGLYSPAQYVRMDVVRVILSRPLLAISLFFSTDFSHVRFCTDILEWVRGNLYLILFTHFPTCTDF